MKTKILSDGTVKQYGMDTRLVKAFGGLDKVLESRSALTIIHELATKELEAQTAKILSAPRDVPNWEHQIATAIGEARTHQKYVDLFTIKEK